MSYAPAIEGYEKTVGQRSDFFKSGNFLPMGDPKKAAKVMLDLVENAEPPIHLVLGSEAYGLLKQADAARTAEMEKWMEVSLSTDHDEAENFLATDLGKSFIKK
ncbi:short chain dehydrogenase [compost metagenome]